MQGIEVVNVRLPSETVKWLDRLVQKRIYKSRSEAIRHFLRNHVLGRKDA
jgi:Arc/MetJ-type ribon-helix-helix transcriptional regulator